MIGLGYSGGSVMIGGAKMEPPPCANVEPAIELIFFDTFDEFIPVEELRDSPFLIGLFVDGFLVLTFADALK
jgi:hypothetical protein